MSTIKTIYHAYHFDVSQPSQAAEWEALKARLKGQGVRVFKAIGDYCNRSIDGAELELETAHLFENQWNTAPVKSANSKDAAEKGMRVFDWAQDSIWNNGHENTRIKRGHYLDQTPEMIEIRRTWKKCGYCGKQEPAAKGYVFCPHCLDSEYLTEKDLRLTRMVYICDLAKKTDKIYPVLTEAERAHLVPLFTQAQIHGNSERGKKRIAQRRAEIVKERDRAIQNANTESDGLLWLMDHGVNTDNVIYYKHTGLFSFGWRKPLDAGLLSALLDVITEFRWPYEIKTADGRTLNGNIG